MLIRYKRKYGPHLVECMYYMLHAAWYMAVKGFNCKHFVVGVMFAENSTHDIFHTHNMSFPCAERVLMGDICS